MRRDHGRAGRGVFPPAQVAEVKALACELPAEQGVPLSRWSSAELAIEAVQRGIVATIAAITSGGAPYGLRVSDFDPADLQAMGLDGAVVDDAGRVLDRRLGRLASGQRRSVLIVSSAYLIAMIECP